MNEIAGQVVFGDHWKDARIGAEDGQPPPPAEPVAGQLGLESPMARASISDAANLEMGTAPTVPLAELIGSNTSDATIFLPTKVAVHHSANIAALVELQKQRVFCIKSQSRCDRSCEAFIARYLGYKAEQPEGERAVAWKLAAKIRKDIEKGGQTVVDPQPTNATEAGDNGREPDASQLAVAIVACAPIVLNSAASRVAWDNHRAQVEKQMRKLAQSLPVYSWATKIKGFGDLGVAIIVGEAGDLSLYATKERVWKRLGLAVIDGERQQRKAGAEAALAHGYNPRRRAEIWTLADSLFRHQWHGAKENIEAGPSGPYGVIYATRKAATGTREGWSPKHRDNDARRVMTKALIEDFWKAWRLAPPRGLVAGGDDDGLATD